jgi:hypothetical protein
MTCRSLAPGAVERKHLDPKNNKAGEAGFMIGAQEGTRTPTMLLAST